MAEQHKGIAMIILGIVAIIAVVGLVLLFTAGKTTGNYVAASEKIYGGDARADRNGFPYWADGQGSPRNVPGDLDQYVFDQQNMNMQTSWNYYGAPKGSPIVDIPAVQTKCGPNSLRVSLNANQAGWYISQGYDVIDPGDGKPGVCVFLADDQRSMMGGVAGWTG